MNAPNVVRLHAPEYGDVAKWERRGLQNHYEPVRFRPSPQLIWMARETVNPAVPKTAKALRAVRVRIARHPPRACGSMEERSIVDRKVAGSVPAMRATLPTFLPVTGSKQTSGIALGSYPSHGEFESRRAHHVRLAVRFPHWTRNITILGSGATTVGYPLLMERSRVRIPPRCCTA